MDNGKIFYMQLTNERLLHVKSLQPLILELGTLSASLLVDFNNDILCPSMRIRGGGTAQVVAILAYHSIECALKPGELRKIGTSFRGSHGVRGL